MQRNLFVAAMLCGAAACSLKAQVQGRLIGGGSPQTYAARAQAIVGGSIQAHVFSRYSIEAELTHLRTADPRTGIRLLGSLIHEMRRDGRAAPYLIYSLGLSRGGALGFGGGARIFVSDRMFVAPQVRLIADANTGGLEFSGGIGFVLRK